MTEEDEGKILRNQKIIAFATQFRKALDECRQEKWGALDSLIQSIFGDCKSFLALKLNKPRLLQAVLVPVFSQTQYEDIRKKVQTYAIEVETPRGQTYAFSTVSRLSCVVYVDLETALKLVEHGFDVFVFDFIFSFFHELIHCAYNTEKTEQECHDIACSTIEEYLGQKIPNKLKKLKASDYYK